MEQHIHLAIPRDEPVREEIPQRKKGLKLGRDQHNLEDTIKLLDQAGSDDRLDVDLSVTKH